MEKYKEPQIYVINNKEVAERLEENFIVGKGNLGVAKRIEYDEYMNQMLVTLDYDLAINLHEYKVLIIDLQNKVEEKVCNHDEMPVESAYLFLMSYPERQFNPAPFVMNQVAMNMNRDSIRIIFADFEYTEHYTVVALEGQRKYRYESELEINIYQTLSAGVHNKAGKRKEVENIELARVIGKYVVEYRVTFTFPGSWDKNLGKEIPNSNYIPLIYNQDKEIISYLGYDELKGYELVLPVCKDKEKLIGELTGNVFPELFPRFFPESKEFNWLKNDDFKPKEIIECEKKKCELEKEYAKQIAEVELQERMIYEKNKFLCDLLVQTAQPLVEAVCKYFIWLGFNKVEMIDGNEEILREDIQIWDGDNLFIVEVKGIGGTSTDSECAQIAKHRRIREKEYRDKNIIPIYVVNHQRYTNPKLREDPPFSKYQIEYAENDERGLLTTWQLYQQYKLIDRGIFTKEETRIAMKKWGLVTLVPENIFFIGQVKEYFKKPRACIFDLVEGTSIKIGDYIWAKKGQVWMKGKICSIQTYGKNVDKVDGGEVGVVLDIDLGKGFDFFVKLQ